MPALKPSDFKTGKEYRWAKKARAKEQRAAIRPFTLLGMFPLMLVWIFTGSFLLGLLAAVAVPVLLFGLIVAYERSKH